MALQKIIFPSSTVTAVSLGALFAGILQDGSVDGCAVIYQGGAVNLAEGYLVACGRLIHNNAAISQAVPSVGAAQVVLVIDASGAGTLSLTVRTADTEGGLPALTQEDINNGVDTDYELEIALVIDGVLARFLGAATAKNVGIPADRTRKITVSSSLPSGGSDGDIWLVVS